MSTISTTLVAQATSLVARIDSTLFPQSCYRGAHLQLGKASTSVKGEDRLRIMEAGFAASALSHDRRSYSLFTLALPLFATQMFAPSKAMPCGAVPMGEVTQGSAIARPNLGYGISIAVPHPNIHSVKG